MLVQQLFDEGPALVGEHSKLFSDRQAEIVRKAGRIDLTQPCWVQRNPSRVSKPLPESGFIIEHQMSVSAGAEFSSKFTLKFVIMLGWKNIFHLRPVRAVEEHADEHHSTNDVANSDWNKVPKDDLTEVHT
jgi:hypothetical protein